jgi:hypothetical protein
MDACLSVIVHIAHWMIFFLRWHANFLQYLAVYSSANVGGHSMQTYIE